MLGIHPGWGGTVRLPRLIGVASAMDLILSGRSLRAQSAKRMGLVDAAVPKRQLIRAAHYFIENQPPRQKPSKLASVLNSPVVRPLLAKYLRMQVAKKANPEHYPAPYAVLDNWVRDGAAGEKAMIHEAESIGKLLVSDTSRNLVRLFFLQERLKGFGKGSELNAKHVHVIGAGTMGGDIAAWCALRGFQVTLQDREAQFIAPAIGRAYKLFKKKLKKPHMVTAAMDRLIPDTEGLGIAKADVIIEAIFENIEVKQALFKDLEARAKSTAILATNTSSIPLEVINNDMKDRSRLVGIHFFNPVAQMQIVEVVRGDQSDEKVFKQAMGFVTKIGRLPLPVKDSPGFMINRILSPYLMECFTLLEEGVSGQAIDKAATDFGMVMGPVEMADVVGLDVCLSVAKNMQSLFNATIPKRLEEMVEKGDLGKKTGRGFYTYRKGKPVKTRMKKHGGENHRDIADRLILRLVNEAMAVVREGIVADEDLLDVGMVFGAGFAPFRGGPLNYAKSMDSKWLNDMLSSLAERYGERFQADSGWQQ